MSDESLIESFKRDIIRVLDIDPKLVEKASVKPNGLGRSLKDFPSKLERMGEKADPVIRKKAPAWTRSVMCPRCSVPMVPIKSHNTTHDEAVTYQCHNLISSDRHCLLVVSVTSGVYHLMREGDFSMSDWDWQRVARRSPIAVEGFTYDDSDASGPSVDTAEEATAPVKRPEDPWVKRGARSPVVWDAFWDLIEERGTASEDEIKRLALEKRPQDGGKASLDALISDIPKWIPKVCNSGIKVSYSNGEFFLERS